MYFNILLIISQLESSSLPQNANIIENHRRGLRPCDLFLEVPLNYFPEMSNPI